MNDTAIAIVGMAGRFPGARNIDELWRTLAEGRTNLRRFTPDEVAEAMRSAPAFVAARPVLDDPLMFDAPFFDMSPREAAATDPQQRLLLECAWEALEHAGYDPARTDGPVGVYAGSDVSTYAPPDPLTLSHDVPAMIAFDKDYLATRVAFKLNLRGPAMTVQTACSTSLVAVQLACQALLCFQCDMALAGGVSVAFPQTGYLHRPGGIFSPDGVCRPFEARAQGTVRGDGVAMVVLKRLADALEARDTIHAVIRGAAINNDGADKMSYAAPSEAGQVEVISLALALAGIDPETIGYMEAHGTGTELGDPIEVAALTRAWNTERTGYCALGSLKANVGHMIAASGIGGLIKAVLALEHAAIPPMPNFEAPNPRIDFDATPFYVARSLEPWPRGEHPRRAAVSSFGIGGTNAHAVLEEAPLPLPTSPARGAELVVVSARSPDAARAASLDLACHLRAHPEQELADVAYTLFSGRKLFDYRCMVVADSADDAAHLLTQARIVERPAQPGRVTFMFPGQGTQRLGMGRELYESEPVFRDVIDQAARALLPTLGLDLRHMLYPSPDREADAAEELAATRLTQPALLAVEVALARLWMSWGVVPDALIGHSLGELAAACLAGVMSFEDALAIVARRGTIVGRLPRGAMLAIASEQELPPGVEIAAYNAPGMRVVSGPRSAIVRAERLLRARGVACTRLRTSHAFHSTMMDPAVPELEEAFIGIELRPPAIPFVSNVTGTWISDAQAMDPHYWGRQLREPVRFSQGVTELLSDPDRVFLEVGPGRVLCDLLARHDKRRTMVPCLTSAERRSMLHALGGLYLADVPIDRHYAGALRRRIPLPSYPFERKRHAAEEKRDWLYVPTCKRMLAPSTQIDTQASWLVCSDGSALAKALEARLRELGASVTVSSGELFENIDARYVVDLGSEFFASVALARRLDKHVNIGFVTRGVVDVLGSEPVCPENAMLLGLARVLPQEAPNARAVVLDGAGVPNLDGVLAEICAASSSLVAFRGASRWTLAFEPLTAPRGASLLRERGTYLIAGLGTIGWTLAEHLARKLNARLVLVQRSRLEQTRVQHLEALGAEVLACRADVSDEQAMAAVVEEATHRFGALHGAIHAAGSMALEDLRPIADLDPDACAVHFRAKVEGVRVLEKVLPDALDFCVLCSSLSTAVGGKGLAAYSAAAHFMDAVARRRSWISIGWDAWHADDGALAHAGAELFEKIVCAPAPAHVLVTSTTPRARTPVVRKHVSPPPQALNSTEAQLADAWRAVLGVDTVDRDASFFDLGGDSLGVVELVSRLRAVSPSLSVRDVFDAPSIDALSKRISFDQHGIPARDEIADFYDAVNRELDRSSASDHAIFLNYGYVANDAPRRSHIRLPDQLLNRTSVDLVLEVLGDHPFSSTDAVLDVGCGRGAVCAVLREYFDVGRYVGVDLSSAAIEFCKRIHRDPRNEFVVGTAMALPFADARFDVVTNVESSHCYPDLQTFYREVARVLRTGGTFLYTDLLPFDRTPEPSGFECIRRDDITCQVLAACDRTAARRRNAFGSASEALDTFLGVPGSLPYEHMKSGRQRYILCWFRKTGNVGERLVGSA